MELTNKTLNLDVSKEYQNEKFVLSGIRQIRLGYLPSGVEIWISTENTGDNLYKLDVKGDGWKDLPEPLYDLYITTKGVNFAEKLVLYYSGESSDYYAVGNATTEQVNRVNSIESFGGALLGQLEGIKYLARTDNILYANLVNGSFSYQMPSAKRYGSCVFVNKTLDFSTLDFKEDSNYLIELQGHADFGSLFNYNETDTSADGYGSQEYSSLHFNLFDINTLDLTGWTDLSSTQSGISNLYFYYDAKEIETIDNHATIFGFKRMRAGWLANIYNNGCTSANFEGYAPTDINFNKVYLINGVLFKKLNYLLISMKNRFTRMMEKPPYNLQPYYGAHYSLSIIIRKLENIVGQPKISSLPYINNNAGMDILATSSQGVTTPSYYFAYAGNEKLVVSSQGLKNIEKTIITNIPTDSIKVEAFGIMTDADSGVPNFANALSLTAYYTLDLANKKIGYVTNPPTDKTSNTLIYFKLTNELNGDYIGYFVLGGGAANTPNTPEIKYQSS